MDKELEENLKELLEKSNQKDKCDICITNNTLETILNYIENSIPTSVVEEKIDKLEKQKQEKEKILEEVNNVIQKQQSTESELDGAYQYYDETYDEKEKIIYQLQILQELLQRNE